MIRFGESQGFERDKLRHQQLALSRLGRGCALNKDLPYADFVRYQLAGDLLEPNNPSAIAATGFLVAGPCDEVGKTQQSTMKAVVRQDELEDYVSVVGQTFLGLTVNCARCHDHKFDPILQRQYYQLAASMAGVEHGQRDLDLKQLSAAKDSAIASLQARQQAVYRREYEPARR